MFAYYNTKYSMLIISIINVVITQDKEVYNRVGCVGGYYSVLSTSQFAFVFR